MTIVVAIVLLPIFFKQMSSYLDLILAVNLSIIIVSALIKPLLNSKHPIVLPGFLIQIAIENFQRDPMLVCINKVLFF